MDLADHGAVHGDRVSGTAGTARPALGALAEVGVDLEEVHQHLEEQGVDKFESSWRALAANISEQLEQRRVRR